MDFKNLKFGPNIADHDLLVKIKKIDELLQKGKHVKCTVFFQGRNVLHPENGDKILDKILTSVKNGKVVNRGKLKGNSLEMFLAPKKTVQ